MPAYTADAAALWQVCDLTGGLPLALELAAQWADTLPLADLAAELAHNIDLLARTDGAQSTRHSSMRAVFDIAWQRLQSAEQAALARLAVFYGGCTRAAAATVAGADLATLTALVRHSLVTLDVQTGRYHIHALLRQYALEQLDRQHARAATEAAHAADCLALARSFERHLHTPAQKSWLDRLAQEEDNLHAALRWLLRADAATAGALALALAWYWRLTSRVVEGRDWLERALAANQTSDDVALLAGLHFSIGHKLWMQGEFAAAQEQQNRSAALWRTLGAAGTRGLARALHSLGMIADQIGDYPTACAHQRQSLALFTQAGDAWGVAFAQQWLGASSLKLGDLATSRANLEASVATVRRLGDQWLLGLDLVWLAQLALADGAPAQAATLAHEAGTLLLTFGHRHGYGAALEVLADAALQQGDSRQAQRHLAAAAQLYTEIGNQRLAEAVRSALASVRAAGGQPQTDSRA